jgi:hypothetical protein
MIEIKIDRLQTVEFDLAPEDVNLKGESPISMPRVSIGLPIVFALTREYMKDDEEAIQVMCQHPDHVFHLVRLACTFLPTEGGRITQAFVKVQCEPEGGATAWSMRPFRDEDITDTSTKATIGSKLGLEGIGTSGSQTTESRGKQSRPYITGLGLQESSPTWKFTPTRGRDINGSFPLSLIVRSLKEIPAIGTVSIRCEEEQKRFALFTFVSPLHAPSALKFTIHA